MNKTEQAVAMLQGMIERGELAPGAMVSERTIVEIIGLGRTTDSSLMREPRPPARITTFNRIHPVVSRERDILPRPAPAIHSRRRASPV